MTLLFLSAYFQPEVTSSSYLSDNRNQAFADRGYEMVVYTPMPTRGISEELRNEYKSRKTEIMYDGKMVVHRFNLMREGRNPITRALRYVISCIKQLYFGIFGKDARKCDVMFISSTPPIQGAMAAIVKKVRGIPMIYNLQDIFPDSLVGTGMTKRGSVLWKIGRIIEDFTYRNADKIIVISEDFKQNIIEKGVHEDKIEVIYNWVDENAVVPIPKDKNDLFEELNISRDKFNVVYAGNFGHAQNIDIILKAAEKLRNNSKICFELFGTGGLKDHFINKAKELSLENIHFHPLQPYNRVSNVYSLADVGIVTCKKGIGKGAMPSKTWSILSAGTAVVANYDKGTDIENILTTNNIGLFSDANDIDAFVNAILKLYNDRELCKDMGVRGRKFIINNLTKDIGTSKIINIVEQIKENIVR